jgi:hypothetical protein
VTRISADVSQDQKTATTYYTVRVSVAEEEIARLNDLKLVPGMPVEAFIQTNPRTVVTYLVKHFARPDHARVPRKVSAVSLAAGGRGRSTRHQDRFLQLRAAPPRYSSIRLDQSFR